MSVSSVSVQVSLLNAFMSGSRKDIFVNFTTVLAHHVTINHTWITLVIEEGRKNTMVQIGGWLQSWGGAVFVGILGVMAVVVGILALCQVL